MNVSSPTSLAHTACLPFLHLIDLALMRRQRFLMCLFLCGLLLPLAACGGSADGDLNSDFGSSSGGPYGGDGDGDGDRATSEDGAGDGFGDGDGDGDGSQEPPDDAALTAGAWDDNLNFDFFEDFLSEIQVDMGFEISAEERSDSAHQFGEDRAANTELDIALVLDTTGSMGDELTYLIDEIQDIADEIQDQMDANVATRWALVAYKDEEDAYVTQVTDFAPLSEFKDDLNGLSAAGGGDYPEASAEALRDASQLSWRSDENVARLIFWVADAPHHTSKGQMLHEAIMDAKNGDVHIYPVASSGVDLRTEVSMRSAAQVTGGRYLFLTDDSGIGDSHLEPTIPCYFVTTLADAMVRMVTMELTGDYVEPTEEQIIRTGGDPKDGACTLSDGEQVHIL